MQLTSQTSFGSGKAPQIKHLLRSPTFFFRYFDLFCRFKFVDLRGKISEAEGCVEHKNKLFCWNKWNRARVLASNLNCNIMDWIEVASSSSHVVTSMSTSDECVNVCIAMQLAGKLVVRNTDGMDIVASASLPGGTGLVGWEVFCLVI